MLDYRGIEALYTVQELQSFEAAAKKLHITQSAVSQRIKGLEKEYGEPVLIRTLPYRPTALGNQLIGHFKRLCVLEEDLKQQLGAGANKPRFSIAINRDSLDTWFLKLMEEKKIFDNILLEIIADDQELTINYLKNGMVSACLSTCEKEILGGSIYFVGNMEYVLAGSPQFVRTYFSKGTPKQCLKKAPAIIFDKNDKLHERYLEKYFGMNAKELQYHVVPSVQGFKKFALMGYGCALIPKIDMQNELNKKQLVEIYPDKVWNIPLYWHHWAVESKSYQKFNAEMIQHTRKALKYTQRLKCD